MENKELNLTMRQRSLLSYMNSRQTIVSGQELADRLDISTRTLRTLISALNNILDENEVRIESVPGKGYQLRVGSRSRFLELITQKKNLFSREDRLNFLILTFLTSDGIIDLNELEEHMFVSRTTLENDVRELRSLISENEPFLTIKQNKDQLIFEDDEMKKRDVLVHLCIEKWDYSSEEGICNWENVLDAKIVHWTRETLGELLDSYHVELDDYSMIYMKVVTSVLYMRNLGGHRLYNSIRVKHYGKIWKLVRELLDRLSREWQIDLEEEDYDWVAYGFEAVRPFSLHPDSYEEEKADCSQEVLETARMAEELLKDRYEIEFPGDECFSRELLLNVKLFYNRKISVHPQSHFEADQLAKNHVYLGEAGRYLNSFLFSHVDWNYRKGEENWLVPMLASATERRIRTLRSRITVGVISHFGMGLTQYLCDNLNKYYGTRLNLIGVETVYKRQRLIDAAPELLITTVELELLQQYGIPVVNVSPSLLTEERAGLDLALKRIETAALYEPLPKPLAEYLPKETKICLNGKHSLQEVKELLKARASEYLSEAAFPDLSEWCGTALNDTCYLVYTLDADVSRTCFAEAMTEHPMSGCPQKQICRVIAGAVSREDRKYFPALVAAFDL